LDISIGSFNRFEKGRIRRVSNIQIGNDNAFTEGWFLWPSDEPCTYKKIVIGDRNYFNRNLMIDSCNYIEIGSNNMFGPDIYITDSNHTFGFGIAPNKNPMKKGKVKIGDYCWIGAKAIILKDVNLGNYCVVAAGAVVTKSFPDGSLIGGVPARLIRKLEKNEKIE
jgi:acetyltransferase-like isoleucine patch superfamily enzyme